MIIWSKNTLRIHKKLITLGALIVLFFLFIPALLLVSSVRTHNKEKKIEKAFNEEVKTVPSLKVTRFMLWEGDSYVTATIKDKSTVGFWYGEDKRPRIDEIGSYPTSFDCFSLKSDGKKNHYEYTVNLSLGDDSLYKKWLSVTIKSLADLTIHYDEIISGLKKLPYNPPLVRFHDFSGERRVREYSDPNFVVQPRFNGRTVTCDLYFSNKS